MFRVMVLYDIIIIFLKNQLFSWGKKKDKKSVDTAIWRRWELLGRFDFEGYGAGVDLTSSCCVKTGVGYLPGWFYL